MRKIIPKEKVKVVASRGLEFGVYAEHVGFVALAAVEVVGFGHSAVFFVSIWLFISGCATLIKERPSKKIEQKLAE